MTFRQFLGLYGVRFMSDTFRPMRSVADVMIDRVEPEDPAVIAEITGGRTEFPASLWRFLLLWARRSGKSLFVGLVGVYFLYFKEVERTQLGEILRVQVIAPSRQQCRVIFGYVRALIHEIPTLEAMIVAETAESITLSNGRMIEIGTANSRTLRGYQFIAFISDETCHLTDEDTASNPLSEILTAVEPSLAAIGGQLFMVSSVYARTGTVYETYQQTFGKNDPETLSTLAATRTMNPTVPEGVIQRAIERDGSKARAEWLSIFRDDLENLFVRDALTAVTPAGRRELPRVAGISYRGGLDIASGVGRTTDSAVGAVGHTEIRNGVEIAVLDAICEVQPPFSPAEACAKLGEFYRRYGVHTVVSDRWGSQFVIEAMQRHGVRVVQAAKPKSDLYLELATIVNSKACELLDSPRLIGQLAALERATGRGGRDSVDHPKNGHDDVANGAALVLTGKSQGSELRIRALDVELSKGSDVRAQFHRSSLAAVTAAMNRNPFK